jgi:hypothetical protein
MRLAHPPPKLIPAARAHLIPLHESLEILRAHPARVQLAQQPHEGLDIGLLARRRTLRVLRCDGVQERPGGAAELLDVWRAVGWGLEGRFGCCGLGFREGGEICEGGAGTTSVYSC